MDDAEVLVVGAGLAGLSAAAIMAEAGLTVVVVDQASRPGGNIHRQPAPGVVCQRSPRDHRQRWRRVMGRLDRNRDHITFCFDTRFGGVDRTGTAFVEACSGGQSRLLRPTALVIATGAVERVMPRPGWTLPGVMTVGAIQAMLKTVGRVPERRILLGGSGPLLLAVGAELCRAGTPPIAVVEAARPFHSPLTAARLPFDYIREALNYLAILRLARVPLITGTEIVDIREGLGITVRRPNGSTRDFATDVLGLHDGLARNDYGTDDRANLILRRAGDCRELLGSRAAELDGLATGIDVARQLGRTPPQAITPLARHRRAQELIRALYARDVAAAFDCLPDQTVLCRCENKTLGVLRSMNRATIRETRLLGRFAMGPCQGRFCAEWVAHTLGTDSDLSNAIAGCRWPVRPVTVHGLVNATEPASKNGKRTP